MISLYPLLVSNTISKNIVPGVCKVLENYIIVYGLTGLLQRIRSQSREGGDWRIRNNKIIKMENIEVDLPEFLFREIIEEQSGIYGQAGPGTKNPPSAGAAPGGATNIIVNVKPEDKKGGSDASVKLDPYNLQTISLEPTWMKIDQIDKNGNKMSGVIGVKVVPYSVKSDAKLSQLLMYDNQVKKLQRLAIMTGRKLTNFLYRIWMKAWLTLPFTSASTTVTGDPRKDILLKRNIMNTTDVQDIFVLANQAELNDDFYQSAKGMINLQKMGWGSIMIADDVNRRVAFCMRELQGLCSIMPYTMLYQTFSQAKVYEDIEDAKRNASSIFKVKREKMSKLIGEGIAQQKAEKFSFQELPFCEGEVIAEAQYLDENLGSFMKTLNPSNIKTILTGVVKGTAKNIPSVSKEKIVQLGTKLDPDFRKGYILSRKVIGNSAPGVSENMIEWAALLVSIRAGISKSGDFMASVKDGIKKFVISFRKVSSKADKPDKPDKIGMPTEHYLDAVFGWVIIMFSIGMVAMIPAIGTIGVQLSKALYNDFATMISGIDKNTMLRTAEDWGHSMVEPGKEFLIESGPWVALIIIMMWMVRSILRK